MTMIEQEGPVEDGVPGPGRVSGRQIWSLDKTKLPAAQHLPLDMPDNVNNYNGASRLSTPITPRSGGAAV